MIPTYVINMNKDINKMDEITKNLESTDLEVMRFSATLGKEAPLELQKKYLAHSTYQKYTLPFVTDFMKGCALSHLRLYDEFLKGNDEYILVLEDDARLTSENQNSNISSKIKQIISQYPSDWDIIRLIYQGFCNVKSIDIKFLCGSTAAYLISRRGAQKMLKNGCVGNIDLCMSYLRDFKIYNHPEQLFEPPNPHSTSRYVSPIEQKILSAKIGDGDLPIWFYLNSHIFKDPMTNKSVNYKQIIIFILLLVCVIKVYRIMKINNKPHDNIKANRNINSFT